MKSPTLVGINRTMQTVVETHTLHIQINSERVRKFLLFVILFLIAGYVVSGLVNKVVGVDNLFTQALYYLFDMDGENNIPAAFSFFILLTASGLLTFTGLKTYSKGDKKFWFLLGAVFVFLACDELMQIHENISAFVKANYANRVAGSDFVWVLPYGIFTLIMSVLLLRFVLRLPTPTRNLFFLSAFIYVCSALGIDYVQGVIQRMSSNKIYYKVLTAIEEPGEMIGIVFFIYAILNYIIHSHGRVIITLDRSGKHIQENAKLES